uniref:N-acetyl-D-glucosamine kinase n=1 Tax=Acrobeloides nanus TaxID=290746 RepID=A0A914C7L7_9BILA
MIFAGVEGGATHSKIILIKVQGHAVQKLIELKGESLNCMLRGAEFTSDYVSKLIQSASEKLHLSLPIDGVCMGLAGAGNIERSRKITQIFKQNFSHVARNCFVTTDAVAAIATAFKNGGIVIIAGTGSACRFLNRDGEIFGTGGHGHLIEDGGGGFWIAQQAIRTIFNDEEGLILAPYSTKHLKELIMNHFRLNEFEEILNLLYGTNFSKAKIASVCEEIAENAQNDPLCKLLFENAGVHLARHLVAISRNFDQELLKNVSVLQVGSVFKSWNLLKPGFENILRTKSSNIQQVSFYQLTESGALGAALLAAKKNYVSTDFEYNTSKFVDSIIL